MSATQDRRAERWRRYWDNHARSYDRQIRIFERLLFGDSRAWICSQATGEVVEVAIGTGLNLPFYPPQVQLTGIEQSPAMLALAQHRAEGLGRAVDLRQGDAHALALPDACFDTVVCTLSLCAIPDERRALAEMRRVLRPGGRLLLVDHVASWSWPVRAIQRLIELITIPLGGEHLARRPFEHEQADGFQVERHERFKFGIVERITARKPAQPASLH
jgi:ubiquinone/menaquinone biosynthesis C-methylase UbiE